MVHHVFIAAERSAVGHQITLASVRAYTTSSVPPFCEEIAAIWYFLVRPGVRALEPAWR